MFLVHIMHNISIAISSGNNLKIIFIKSSCITWRFFLSHILFVFIYIEYIKKMVSKIKVYLTLPNLIKYLKCQLMNVHSRMSGIFKFPDI